MTKPSARRRFDETQVVDAAVRLIDEGGAAALSVRAVATALGVLPNAIYTYVADRAALEAAVVERVLGLADLDLLHADHGSWKQRVEHFARSFRNVLHQHPGTVGLLMTAPLQGPVATTLGERLLDAMADSGLDPADGARAVYALIVYVVGSTMLEVAETDGTAPLASQSDRVAGRAEAFGYLDPLTHPRSHAAAPVMATWITDEQFDWGLRTLLHGIERQINRTPTNE